MNIKFIVYYVLRTYIASICYNKLLYRYKHFFNFATSISIIKLFYLFLSIIKYQKFIIYLLQINPSLRSRLSPDLMDESGKNSHRDLL